MLDVKKKLLRAKIAFYLELRGYTKKDLAIKLGMCPASLYNKLNDPGSFTLNEFTKLLQLMGLSDEEKLQII